MKVQPDIESQKKFTSNYFTEERFVKERYSYVYGDRTKQRIDVAFNVSSDFCRPLGVTITSVLENNADLDVHLHIFIDAIDEQDKARIIEQAQKYQQNAYIYIMNIEEFTGFHIKHKRFKHVSYFRLYMNKILQKITDRFIYLDADLICLRSMKPFLEVDFAGKTIAAVADLPNAVRERSAYLGLEHGNYLDSGVLIIDCKAWEERKITEKCFAYQHVPAKCFTCHDQDVLNLVLDGDVQYIDSRFNFLGIYGWDTPEGCMIYHFFGREKPWNLALRAIDKEWRRYLEISPWENIDGELPAKKGANYFNYKRAAQYYKTHNKFWQSVQCRFWYGVLKIMNYIGL